MYADAQRMRAYTMAHAAARRWGRGPSQSRAAQGLATMVLAALRCPPTAACVMLTAHIIGYTAERPAGAPWHCS